MADIQKPAVTAYEYASPEQQAAMNPLILDLQQQVKSLEAVSTFGAEAAQQFRGSLSTIQKFLEDPSSPEADARTRDKLRDDYLLASLTLALTLGAGKEVLRRYESEYLEEAAEMLMITNGDHEQKQIDILIECRDALDKRLKDLQQPEHCHSFVCDAITQLENGRQFSLTLARGMPLEENILVRRPLQLQPR
ncbi:MAG: hypothetical protein ACAH83_07145 [Alphaproteobacteria bacterium]